MDNVESACIVVSGREFHSALGSSMKKFFNSELKF